MKAACLFLLFLVLSIVTPGQVKKVVPPEPKPLFADTRQVLVVTTHDWTAVTGRARLYERKNTTAKWKPVGDSFPVVVGRNGMAWADPVILNAVTAGAKIEGDGKTPAGLFPLTLAFGGSSKPNAVQMPYTKLDQYTECVDDVKSHFYNQIVNRMQVGNFDWKSSEKMLEVGEQYDLGLFVAHNSYPVIRGNGSCIFLHIWQGPQIGTAGCTAMERKDLEILVSTLAPAKVPFLVQMPADIYERYRKSWNLPEHK